MDPIRQTERNIEAIVALERQHLEQRSHAARLGDQVARFLGSIWFAIIQIALMGLWIVANTFNDALGLRAVDPFPYPLMNLILAGQAIFLTSFVLMSETRQARLERHRAHLDLQVNLLAEQEATKMLEMLAAICDKLDLKHVARDPAVQAMVRATEVGDLSRKLEQTQP